MSSAPAPGEFARDVREWYWDAEHLAAQHENATDAIPDELLADFITTVREYGQI